MTSPPPLKRVRVRKAPVYRPKEHELQFASAALFHGSKKNPPTLRKDWRAFHVPNGERRSPAVGAKLKRMGVLPGVPDWVLVAPLGYAHFIELKRVGEKTSESQRDFQAWCAGQSIAHGIAYCLADVIRLAKLWDALDPNVQV